MLTETREKILKGTIQVFNKKGLKLTMDDVAEELKISKKTIYKEFKSKDEIFDSMVDYVFDNIKAREQEILESEEYSTLDKIRLLLSAMPASSSEPVMNTAIWSVTLKSASCLMSPSSLPCSRSLNVGSQPVSRRRWSFLYTFGYLSLRG